MLGRTRALATPSLKRLKPTKNNPKNNQVYNYNITKYRKSRGAQGIIRNRSPYKDL